MYKPNNYDKTQVDKPKVEAGGHHGVVKKVEETTSKNGKKMIIVFFDFDQTDKQPSFFAKEFRDDVKPDKKWPVLGRRYILLEDAEGNTNRDYKRFITSCEKSNDFAVNWEADYQQFANKKIGLIFGPVENEYQGRNYVRNELRFFCDYSKAASAEIPDLKPLKQTGSAAQQTSPDGFMTIPDAVDEEEFPFN